MSLNIVVTDAFLVSAGGVSWDPLREIGNVTLYDDTLPEELPERIKDADAIFTNRCRFPEEIIKCAPHLKMIGTFGTGVDIVDCEAARRHGVAVCNIPGYGRGAVAQMAIAFMFEIGRQTSFFNDWMKNTGWVNSIEADISNVRQMEFTGKTIGIIGMGDIGYAVAKVCMAMDMKVLAYRRHPKKELECDQLKFVDLDTLLRESDIISTHCPLTDETRGLINKEAIAKMKDGVVLINVGRGPVFNTADVVDGLNSGKIYACGVDVFDPEPCGKTHPLATHPRCFASPHVAWSPLETRQRIVNMSADNLRNLLNGTPTNVKN